MGSLHNAEEIQTLVSHLIPPLIDYLNDPYCPEQFVARAAPTDDSDFPFIKHKHLYSGAL